MTELDIPSLCLVVLVDGDDTMGVLDRFEPTEVLRLTTFEGLLGGPAPEHAEELMRDAAERRLALARLTVVHAGAADRNARQRWVKLAKAQHVPVVALTTTGARLDKEGFDVRRLEAPFTRISRRRPSSHRHEDAGPFDIVGDVHGCLDELRALLERLGYRPDGAGVHQSPEGRRALFVGDLVDRGPDSVGVLRLVMPMVEAGHALVLEGNHEAKLARKLRGRAVKLDHGLDRTWAEFEREPPAFHDTVLQFLEGLPHHLVLDGGRLVCAHAGLPEAMHGRQSGRVRSFALYGDTNGKTAPDGLPIRRDWSARYRGDAAVVYGHTPVSQALWRNGTLCLDTGCVFGGRLTALRWPERQLVSVPAHAVHYPPPRPLEPPPALPQLEGAIDVTPFEGPEVHVSAEDVAKGCATLEHGGVPTRALFYLPVEAVPSADDLRAALLEYREAGVAEVLLSLDAGTSLAALLVHPGRDAWDVSSPGVAFDAAGARVDLTTELTTWAHEAEHAGLFDALASDWLLLEGTLVDDTWYAHHLLASEGQLHLDRAHAPLTELGPTPPRHRVSLADQAAWDRAEAWLAGRPATVRPRWIRWSDTPPCIRIPRPAPGHARADKRSRWRAQRQHRFALEAARRATSGASAADVQACLLAVLSTP